MKTAIFLFFLLVMYATIAKAGLPPTSLKGQSDTNATTTFFYQVPNNQATPVAGSTGLIETGNDNILSNPNFEHTTATTSWTNNGTEVGVAETSVVINGKKSLFFNPSSETINLVQSSTAYQAQFADGVQCLAMVNVKSAASGVKVCSVQAGTVSTTNCVDVVANSKWGLYKVPFICGATSNGISISSTGSSITGAVYVDAAFVGAVDLKADVPSVIRDAVVDATNGAMTYSTASLALKVSSTLTTLNRGVISVDNSGSTTKFVALKDCTVNISWTSNMATAGNSLFFRKNGVIVITGTQSPSNSTRLTVSGEFDLVKGDYLELYSSSTTSAGSLSLTAIHSESGSVYSSTNADTDWASCGHTTSDFTGFGTVTNIETQCKRQGSDLLMRGKFTSGTPSGSEARVNLKLGGVALTSASSPTIASIQKAGDYVFASTTSQYLPTVLIEPSVGYLTFGLSSNTNAGLTKQNASTISANGIVLSISARIPISGWTNSNIIIGQFNGLESCSSTDECTDIYSANVSNLGVVSEETPNDWISGNASLTDTSLYGFTFNSKFTVAPHCWSEAENGTTGYMSTVGVIPTASTVSIRTSQATSKGASGFKLFCRKQGADYIGKTAKAVASDQNIATPGVTKVKACYYAFGGASATLASPTACTTGTCTEVVDTCGTGSPPSWGATGAYANVVFSSGTFANTTPVFCSCTSYNASGGTINDCAPYNNTAQTWASSSSGGYSTATFTTAPNGTQLNGFVILKCEGQAP